MVDALAIMLLALPAFYGIVVAAPLIGAPERWPAAGSWVVGGRLERPPRPSSFEIRFWAVVWTAIADAWVAFVMALVIAA